MCNGSVLLLKPLIQLINSLVNMYPQFLTVFTKSICALGLFIKPSDFLFLLLDLFRYLGILLVLLNGQATTGLFGSGDLYSVAITNLG